MNKKALLAGLLALALACVVLDADAVKVPHRQLRRVPLRRRVQTARGGGGRLNPSTNRRSGGAPHTVTRVTHDPDVVSRHAASEGISLIQVYASTHLHSGSTLERSAAEHYGLSVEQFRAAHLELQSQRTSVKGATCSGLVPSLCPGRADIHGGPGDWIESIAEECGEIFCSPMCMRNTWSCAVEFGDLEPEAEDPAYSKALCGQFFAEGCTNILSCCENDEKMMDYVENHQYQDRFPVPYLPTPSCEHDAKDGAEEGKLCGQCSGAVEVNLEAVDCPFPVVDPDEDDAFVEVASGAELEAHNKDKAMVDTMSMEELLSEIKTLRTAMKLPRRALAPNAVVIGGDSDSDPRDTASQSLNRRQRDARVEPEHLSNEDAAAGADSSLLEIDNRVSSRLRALQHETAAAAAAAETAALTSASTTNLIATASNGGEPWDAGPAKFKSLKYRCEKLKVVVEGALGGMTAAFKAKACSCMGCCAGECFFHVKERMVE